MKWPPRIVIFTRWPEPGKAKTRLIPALGADRAAAIHRRLTEQTLETVRLAGFEPQVCTTGALPEAFADWLGPGIEIGDQGDGDLGDRLARASSDAPVILLGSDGPDLRPEHVQAAVDGLGPHPAVIGPAEDGGYWLLGLAAPAPHLFVDMPWSTDAVCRITLQRLKAGGLDPLILETLADLDRPEDLARWPELLS